MRRSFCLLDQTMGPHKSYKYTYVPDPRKLAPIETMSRTEVLPRSIRPPTSAIPDHGTFLEKIDVNRRLPTSDFKSVFTDWNDLMTCGIREMRKRGVPHGMRKYIRDNVGAWHNGTPPERFDTKAEWLYYKQFKNKDFSYRIVPELPEKYRPHMNGIDSQPLPDYVAINMKPEWAVKEEQRLAEKRKGK